MEGNLKNVLVLSFGFLLLFTAYGGLQSLQSSLYSEEGLGVAALSTLYGGMLLSSMFLPPVLIGKLGCKWTLVLAMCCYVAFSLGNFYASWYTLIPASVLVGLGAAALWSAQGTYLTIVGNMQARKTGQVGKDVVSQYFGIFFLIFQSSGVWGNLISSLVFSQTPTQGTIPEEQLQACGASDCLMATVSTNSTKRPSQDLIYTLLGIYTGCGFLAVLLMAVFLEPVRDAQPEGEGEKQAPPFWSTLLSTFKLLRDKRLRLLILLPMLSGFEQAFLSGDYTRSYTTCALGIQFVGYVMICFGAVDALCSVLFGRLARHTGRTVLFALGRRVLGATWGGSAALWAVAACVKRARVGGDSTRPAHLWTLQRGPLALIYSGPVSQPCFPDPRALFGVLFEKNKEAAFANYRLWEALGFVIAFGYSTFLCVSVKLYVLLGVLSAAMAAYGAVEYTESRKADGPLGLVRAVLVLREQDAHFLRLAFVCAPCSVRSTDEPTDTALTDSRVFSAGARKLLLESKRWALGDPRPHPGSDQVYAVALRSLWPPVALDLTTILQRVRLTRCFLYSRLASSGHCFFNTLAGHAGPSAETLPQRVQRFLPRRHANRRPFHQSVCLLSSRDSGDGGRSHSRRSLGLWQQSAVRLFPVSLAGAQRPGPGEAGKKEAPVCAVCPSGAGDQRASITWTTEAERLRGAPWRAGRAPTRT
ncbi:PREDICTED: protein unc-93 homolog A [Bison bison bison]|uniref:Protein unc-93 homolog A n=1 Tax=Bison bison bison TaxID=43346 RepID=A0A6P3HTV8_BISBB|nr:PREDICTED: protein unc-93 homolog A [Bison bison bison]